MDRQLHLGAERPLHRVFEALRLERRQPDMPVDKTVGNRPGDTESRLLGVLWHAIVARPHDHRHLGGVTPFDARDIVRLDVVAGGDLHGAFAGAEKRRRAGEKLDPRPFDWIQEIPRVGPALAGLRQVIAAARQEDVGKPILPLQDVGLCRESSGGQACAHDSVGRRLTRVQTDGFGAESAAQGGGTGSRDAERDLDLFDVEAEKLGRHGGRSEDAEGSRVVAPIHESRSGHAGAHGDLADGLVADDVGLEHRAPAGAEFLAQREGRRDQYTARVADDPPAVVVPIQDGSRRAGGHRRHEGRGRKVGAGNGHVAGTGGDGVLLNKPRAVVGGAGQHAGHGVEDQVLGDADRLGGDIIDAGFDNLLGNDARRALGHGRLPPQSIFSEKLKTDGDPIVNGSTAVVVSSRPTIRNSRLTAPLRLGHIPCLELKKTAIHLKQGGSWE